MAVAKVTLNGTTLMDTTDATADASKILNTYTAYIHDGSKATGTATGGGGIDAPTFTVTWDDNWESILSVTCDWTFAEVYSHYNRGDYLALIINTDQSGTVEFLETATLSAGGGSSVDYTVVRNWLAFYDIHYTSNNVASIIQPSRLDEILNVTANDTYYPTGIISEVNVNVPSSAPTLQAKTNIAPSTSSQTITADSGFDGLSSVQINAMPSGTAGTPTASKGTVSNNSVSVTPSVTNTTGYITGSTKTGTAVTVSASELVSGSQTVTTNGTVDVTNLASVVVNVSGSSKNIQIDNEYKQRTANSYGDTGLTLTVAKTGTYKVTWTAWRGSSSGTMGTNLHVNDTTGTNQQTWTGTYGQLITLTDQSYTQGDVLTLYATSGSNSRSVYVSNLMIIEQ